MEIKNESASHNIKFSPLIECEFSMYSKAVTECHDLLNRAVSLEDLLMCGAYTYTKEVMKAKHYMIYKRLAFICGFGEQTQPLKEAIKSEWHDKGEEFVGFWQK